MVNRKTSNRDDERRGAFTYTPRDPKRLKERAEQTGGNFESIFKNGVTSFRPKQGDNQFRILPPTWKNAEHYGYDIYVHSFVGADQGTYLCPKKMLGKRCPICEAAAEAKAAGDDEDAKDLQVKKQVLVYVLDRDGDNPLEPQPYAMSWTMDRDIAALCHMKTTGKILSIDHPQKGYDVLVTRKGQKLQTRYVGLQIDREPTPIAKGSKADAIMEQIEDNPLDKILKIHDEEYLEKIIDGTAEKKSRDEDEDDDDDRSSRRGGRSRARDDDEDDKPRNKRGRSRDDEDDDEDDDAPRGRRKSSRDDDDEDEDDDKPRGRRRGRASDDDDEDEDEKPKGRGRRSRDEDEDEEDPADDDDDPEEDSKPRGRRRSSRDDDDEDEDEDDKPRGRRKSSRDDDEDEDDDEPRARTRVRPKRR